MIKQLIFKLTRFFNKLEERYYKTPVNCIAIYYYLKKEFGDDCYVECTDNNYMTTQQEDLKPLFKILPIKYQTYVSETRDCDNYSKELWGLCSKLFPRLPIGYCHVKLNNGVRHALNIVIYVTKSGRLQYYFIEPQTGEMFVSDYKPYLVII